MLTIGRAQAKARYDYMIAQAECNGKHFEDILYFFVLRPYNLPEIGR